MTLLFFLLCCTLSPAIAQHDLQTLLKQQSSDPANPLTNYNLGVAQYKKSMYQDAANNFSRAHAQETKDIKIKKHALFNAAKSHEQYGLHLLPENWQQPKIRVDKIVLEKAIKALESAVAWYKKDANPDKKIIKNKENAEQLLEQLRKKLEEQKQKQEQDDKNKDNKDSKDKSDKSQSQENQDQAQDKQSDSQQQPGDKNQKSDQGKKDTKSKQKNGSEQSERPENSDKEQKVDKDKQHGDQDEKQNNGKDQAKESSNPAEKGDKDEPDGQQTNTDKQQEDEKSDHKPSPDKKELNANQEASSEGTSSSGKKQETMQTRRMQAMLENLEADESKKQKSLLLQQLNTNQAPPEQGQKPW